MPPKGSQVLPQVYLGHIHGHRGHLGIKKTLLNSFRQLQNCCSWALTCPPACLTLQHPQSAMWWCRLHLAVGGWYRRSPMSWKIRSNYQSWPSGIDFSETSCCGCFELSQVVTGHGSLQHYTYMNPDVLFHNQVVIKSFLWLKFTTLLWRLAQQTLWRVLRSCSSQIFVNKLKLKEYVFLSC